MTDELYLICHKVRGQPAFDVAIILDTLDEDGDVVWLIPTSGHRAYPATYMSLDCVTPEHFAMMQRTDVSACPDHYACNDRQPRSAPSLLDRLNLKPKLPPIIRRI